MTVYLDLQRVEALASRGLTLEQIAANLGIDASTLHRKKARMPELQDAIKRGQSKGISLIANKLFEKARGGNVAAMIFFLKARGGWSEKTEMTLRGDAENPLPIDNRVPDLTPDQVMAIMLKRDAKSES